MTILSTWTQQPGDRLDWDIYYGSAPDGSDDWLSSGDTIASVTTTVDVSGLVVTSSNTTKMVKLWVSSGVSGTKYKVTITITTIGGRIKQDEVFFLIREI